MHKAQALHLVQVIIAEFLEEENAPVEQGAAL